MQGLDGKNWKSTHKTASGGKESLIAVLHQGLKNIKPK